MEYPLTSVTWPCHVLRWGQGIFKVFRWSVIGFWMIAGSGPVFQEEFSLLLVYGVPWITVEPLHNAHLGDGKKWPLVFLKDHTRALFLALAKSIYQPLKLLTLDLLEAMPFFTELVHGAGHQRPLRKHLILSIILVIKLMRKIWSFFCLGILIATSLGLYQELIHRRLQHFCFLWYEMIFMDCVSYIYPAE